MPPSQDKDQHSDHGRHDEQGTANDVLFLGASGLVGSLALRLLLRRARAGGFRVLVPVRRALTLAPELRGAPVKFVVQPDMDASRMAPVETALRDSGFRLGQFLCALGTTIRAAGSQQAFARVDHDLVIAHASLAQQCGASQGILVSSVGADSRARNFYLRTKGKTERDLQGIGLQRVDLLRPGLLLGTRAERRPMEALAQKALPALNPLLCGSLSAYRAIQAETVAAAMIALMDESDPGLHVHTYDALRRHAARLGVG